MTRRELREHIFNILFRLEFHSAQEMEEQLAIYLESLDENALKDRVYIQEKYQRIIDHLQEIDEMINTAASGWKTSRMGKVDLAIIRLAVYEMKMDDDVPVGVAINEAVELAKKYGGDDTPAFINGVLAKIV